MQIYGSLTLSLEGAEAEGADTNGAPAPGTGGSSIRGGNIGGGYVASPGTPNVNQPWRSRTQASGSNIGFRGREDLGNGLYMGFQAELEARVGGIRPVSGTEPATFAAWRNSGVWAATSRLQSIRRLDLRSTQWCPLRLGMRFPRLCALACDIQRGGRARQGRRCPLASRPGILESCGTGLRARRLALRRQNQRDVPVRDEEHQQFRRLGPAHVPADGMRVLRILIEGTRVSQKARFSRLNAATLASRIRK